METFAQWQPRYAEQGVWTFPVDGTSKRPRVRGYLNTDKKRSQYYAHCFAEADAFGFACGSASGLTILDVDSPKESVLYEALSIFGDSPLIWRTGGGNFAAAFRHNGEGRGIKPIPSLPIDLLGGGYAIAPPSSGKKQHYEIIKGTLDDLARLPKARVPDLPAAAQSNDEPVHRVPLSECPPLAPTSSSDIREGERNTTLFSIARHTVHRFDTRDALIDEMREYNAQHCNPPLPDNEIVKLCGSAWKMHEEGRNFAKGHVVLSTWQEIDLLAAGDPDAFALLNILRQHHFGHDQFAIATKAMAAKLGWRPSRLRQARDHLLQHGLLLRLHPGGRGPHDPAQYRLRKPNLMGRRAVKLASH